MAVVPDVSVRICSQEIIKKDLQLKALIQDIRDCPGPQHILDELNFKVKDKVRHLRRRIQDLEQLAKEQDSETIKTVILCEADGHRKHMLSNQAMWRKANLACKLLIDSMERDELLSGEISAVRPRNATKESLVQTYSDITESLMSINRLMSQQVQQSEGTVGSLVMSSRPILETSEEFKALNGAIHLGRKLIFKYNRREVTDKLLIFLALGLFLATVVYIVKKRIFPFL
ncbi:vesicle transport protein SEC20 [Clupea harengus]|uniref:Vesicle transport protein SEC20 n=1 Tax=Clupea harengus TaxID=7950 RepID=A0A6P8FW39_CLUHA|nr:vesicle transport protein SEC20 [Clupea harengus]